MQVFAEKGFEGASLAELTAAMRINRFSMYATYGNKETLYVKAMETFNDMRKARVTSLLGGESARDSLEELLRDIVERFTDSAHGVCFVTQAPLTSKEASKETRDLMAKRRGEVEQAISNRIKKAIKDGELPKSVSADDLARFFAVVIQGLALQAQHGGTKEELLSVVDVAMERWPKA